MIAIIDYGIGNLRSVQKALEHIGAPVQRITDPDALRTAEAMVLPGVGAFGECATNFRAAGFEPVLRERIAAGIPLLGICVGLQLLFEESEETLDLADPTGEERQPGLGIFPGQVRRFPDGMTDGRGHPLKIPQIGWNQIHHDETHPLLEGVPSGSYVYFVHSYYCELADPSLVIATTDYGIDYASVCGREHVWGIQFHPEKSHRVGLRILQNFVKLTRAGIPTSGVAA
ncbi:MAG TPA: imidazole glycerol phosphate synthase subunit HisH, partial [Anaerolineae bacterium]|nr:imidazole glycerol phosphate synthase subunit HisH [Anaerolineae bacterium]